MTEDDTFRTLRRIPFRDVTDQLRAWLYTEAQAFSGEDFLLEEDKFLRQFGWTYADWILECMKVT